MIRALVLGGTRFFGRHLVNRLLEEGAEVSVLSRGRAKTGFAGPVDALVADRRDPAALAAALGAREWDWVFDQVCFEAGEARDVLRLLRGRCDRFVFTSTQSVYPLKADLKEKDFDPEEHRFEREIPVSEDYGEAKRQAESVFAREAGFPVTMARFPIVLGPDDYTRRLHWHIERVSEAKPIFLPNPGARMGFVRATDAGRILMELARAGVAGPVNVASPGAIAMGDLVARIERITGRSAVFAASPGEGEHSPFGVPEDWFMDVARLREWGIGAPELESWLEPLIRQIAESPSPLPD